MVISRLLNSQSIDYQTAMLLNSIGSDALKIYNGFAFDNGDTRDIATILKSSRVCKVIDFPKVTVVVDSHANAL